jgi:hypothetical protein
MLHLTPKERDFIERGGALWCVRQNNHIWQIVKVTWENEEFLDLRALTREQAHRWLFLLVDLHITDGPIAVHHAIAREPSRSADFPILD